MVRVGVWVGGVCVVCVYCVCVWVGGVRVCVRLFFFFSFFCLSFFFFFSFCIFFFENVFSFCSLFLFLFFFRFVLFSLFFSCAFFSFSKIKMLGFLTLAMVKGGSTRDAFTQKVALSGGSGNRRPVGTLNPERFDPSLWSCHARK